MTGTTYEVQRDLPFKSKVVCHKVNDLLMANAAYENAPSIAPPREKTGSTDFGNVLYEVPGSCIRIAREFGEGAKGIIVGCLIIGIARTVEVILSDANILDTIVYGIVNIVNVMPDSIKAVGMFLCQSLINCVIVSGTGQAAVTMPLMVPVSDLVGISRQTSVLAFQLGDGFSNSVLPMSSSLMGYLAVSKIPYSKWLKFMMPLFLIWTALGCLFMLGALMIGY
jgi:uncharacterized ion transporter superfamily protein YfcC